MATSKGRFPHPTVIMERLSSAVIEMVAEHQGPSDEKSSREEVVSHVHHTLLFFAVKELIDRHGEASFRESLERAVVMAKG